MNKKRYHHIDFIRFFLTSLVILHHSSIVYGGAGSWYWIEGGNQLSELVLVIFTAANQAYFVGTFFLLAGYFSLISIKKHGKIKFLKNRFIRLGIPLLFFNFVLSPIVLIISLKAYGQITGNFIDLLRENYLNLIASGPLWFTKTLLIFSIILIFLPQKLFEKKENAGKFKYLNILFYAFAAGITAFLVRLIIPVGMIVWEFQLAYYVQYTVLFFWGASLAKNTDFTEFPVRQARPWFITSILSFFILPLMMFISLNSGTSIDKFFGGWNWQSLAYALWEPFFSVGMIFLVWKISLHFKDIDLKFPIASYGAYVIHPLVIVYISILLRPIQASPFLKFGILGLSSVLICYSVSLLLRKIPGVKKLV